MDKGEKLRVAYRQLATLERKVAQLKQQNRGKVGSKRVSVQPWTRKKIRKIAEIIRLRRERDSIARRHNGIVKKKIKKVIKKKRIESKNRKASKGVGNDGLSNEAKNRLSIDNDGNNQPGLEPTIQKPQNIFSQEQYRCFIEEKQNLLRFFLMLREDIINLEKNIDNNLIKGLEEDKKDASKEDKAKIRLRIQNLIEQVESVHGNIRGNYNIADRLDLNNEINIEEVRKEFKRLMFSSSLIEGDINKLRMRFEQIAFDIQNLEPERNQENTTLHVVVPNCPLDNDSDDDDSDNKEDNSDGKSDGRDNLFGGNDGNGPNKTDSVGSQNGNNGLNIGGNGSRKRSKSVRVNTNAFGNTRNQDVNIGENGRNKRSKSVGDAPNPFGNTKVSRGVNTGGNGVKKCNTSTGNNTNLGENNGKGANTGGNSRKKRTRLRKSRGRRTRGGKSKGNGRSGGNGRRPNKNSNKGSLPKPKQLKKVKKVKKMQDVLRRFDRFFREFKELIKGLKKDYAQDYLYINLANCNMLLHEIITYFDYSQFAKNDFASIQGNARVNNMLEAFKSAFNAIGSALGTVSDSIRLGRYEYALEIIKKSYNQVAASIKKIFNDYRKTVRLIKKADIALIIDLVNRFEKLTGKKIKPRKKKKNKVYFYGMPF